VLLYSALWSAFRHHGTQRCHAACLDVIWCAFLFSSESTPLNSLKLSGVGTILCGLAPTMEFLIFARALAGMGGGGSVFHLLLYDSIVDSIRKQGHDRFVPSFSGFVCITLTTESLFSSLQRRRDRPNSIVSAVPTLHSSLGSALLT
jgi:MFS family permease